MNKTKIVIFGPRDFDDYDFFIEKVVEILDGLELSPDEVEIVEGGARGADRLAYYFCKDYGISWKRFDAEWDRYKRARGKNPAGMIRNEEMADYADKGIGFSNGVSPGTQGMIKIMQKKDKDLYIVNI